MAKLKLFPEPGALETVSMTQLRPHLREVVAAASTHGVKFLITHHGRQVAAIVSVGDMWRIWEDEDLERFGPKHPETGKRAGGMWVQATGWKKGMAVRWTEAGPMIVEGEVAAIEVEEDTDEAGAKTERPERKRWWRFW